MPEERIDHTNDAVESHPSLLLSPDVANALADQWKGSSDPDLANETMDTVAEEGSARPRPLIEPIEGKTK